MSTAVSCRKRFILLSLAVSIACCDARGQDSLRSAEHKTEFFPILSYDTDVGLGIGGKAFILNALGQRESFDLTVFLSTKGERWYRFAFSAPDFELRQGTVYPAAFDLVVDYDKWINSAFFGVGSDSRYEDMEIYTRVPLEVTASLSAGFTPQIVGQAGLRYKTVLNKDFAPDSRLQYLPPYENSGRATAISAYATLRFDSRDSYINPTHGLAVQIEGEFAPLVGSSNVTFTRWSGWIQGYARCHLVGGVVAGRIWLQTLSEDNVPVQMLHSVGGNKTVRGYTQDRYLDNTAAIANLEIRIPAWWRFGAVVGFDAGKVFRSLSEFDVKRWAFSPVLGARFYMDTFVVRADVGFGAETTGFYLNFGHVF